MSPSPHTRILSDLQFLAAAQPRDTFWRAIDVSLVTLETLQILPADERAQYSIAVADACLAVLRRLGGESLPAGDRTQLDSVVAIAEQIKAHANSDDDFNRQLDMLKQVFQDRPNLDEGGKNISNNDGTLFGLNNGDMGDVSFNEGPKTNDGVTSDPSAEEDEEEAGEEERDRESRQERDGQTEDDSHMLRTDDDKEADDSERHQGRGEEDNTSQGSGVEEEEDDEESGQDGAEEVYDCRESGAKAENEEGSGEEEISPPPIPGAPSNSSAEGPSKGEIPFPILNSPSLNESNEVVATEETPPPPIPEVHSIEDGTEGADEEETPPPSAKREDDEENRQDGGKESGEEETSPPTIPGPEVGEESTSKEETPVPPTLGVPSIEEGTQEANEEETPPSTSVSTVPSKGADDGESEEDKTCQESGVEEEEDDEESGQDGVEEVYDCRESDAKAGNGEGSGEEEISPPPIPGAPSNSSAEGPSKGEIPFPILNSPSLNESNEVVATEETPPPPIPEVPSIEEGTEEANEEGTPPPSVPRVPSKVVDDGESEEDKTCQESGVEEEEEDEESRQDGVKESDEDETSPEVDKEGASGGEVPTLVLGLPSLDEDSEEAPPPPTLGPPTEEGTQGAHEEETPSPSVSRIPSKGADGRESRQGVGEEDRTCQKSGGKGEDDEGSRQDGVKESDKDETSPELDKEGASGGEAPTLPSLDEGSEEAPPPPTLGVPPTEESTQGADEEETPPSTSVSTVPSKGADDRESEEAKPCQKNGAKGEDDEKSRRDGVKESNEEVTSPPPISGPQVGEESASKEETPSPILGFPSPNEGKEGAGKEETPPPTLGVPLIEEGTEGANEQEIPLPSIPGVPSNGADDGESHQGVDEEGKTHQESGAKGEDDEESHQDGVKESGGEETLPPAILGPEVGEESAKEQAPPPILGVPSLDEGEEGVGKEEPPPLIPGVSSIEEGTEEANEEGEEETDEETDEADDSNESANISVIAAKRVLVIDGGGLRGLAQLMIIDQIVKEYAVAMEKELLPCEIFDLICGTSIGGLISILLGRLGLDCSTAMKYYEAAMQALLNGRDNILWDTIALSKTIDTDGFHNYLNEIVKDTTGAQTARIQEGQDLRQHASTRMFATTTAQAPDYANDTYFIRSYTAQYPNSLPPEIDRRWSITEVAMVTMASPLYTILPSVKTDKQRSFQDAAFGGYNNPLELAVNECQSNWPHERIETIISLGTGLSSFLPDPLPNLGDKWLPSLPYIQDMYDNLIDEEFLSVARNDDVDANVRDAIRDLACISADTSDVHRQFESQYATHCEAYYRIDESFGLGPFDLVDIDQRESVKYAVNIWLRRDGKQITGNIAKKLVADTYKAKESAGRAKPPPPPPGIVKGYCKLLDEPRPTRIKDYLKKYEVLFIVDDSGSMKKDGRWSEARDALIGVADYALEVQTHTVSMRFLNNSTYIHGLQGSANLVSTFNKVRPSSGTPTGRVLKAVFDKHLERIQTAIPQGSEYSKIPPLDIIVITDGVPSDSPGDVVAHCVQRLNDGRYHPNTMGVQLVQIGDDTKAKRHLKEFVKGANGSIVDTVPYRGKLDSERLQRILLGGMHPNIRASLPPHLLAI